MEEFAVTPQSNAYDFIIRILTLRVNSGNFSCMCVLIFLRSCMFTSLTSGISPSKTSKLLALYMPIQCHAVYHGHSDIHVFLAESMRVAF